MEPFVMPDAEAGEGQGSRAGGTAHTESALAACRVCGEAVEPAIRVREMMIGTREVFGYVECVRCLCLQIESIPADLERYYERAYYTDGASMESGDADRSVKASALRRRWTRIRLRGGPLVRALSGRRYGRFDWFRRTGTGPHDAILDVGCGSGRLLRRLAREGFDRLTGIDPRWPGERGRQDEESQPCFERASLEDHVGSYRLVMAHHSFEHVPDPRAAFAAFARLVEPRGHLLLRIPLSDSWARQAYGADWVQLDAPRHLHLHTRRSIGILVEANGFEIVDVMDDSGPFQIWGSELYRRDVALSEAGRGGRKVLGWTDRLAARRRARRLRRSGEGDQACFVIRRAA